ncbi:glycerol-3-phosphate dehydrogenase/oxidase [Kaistia sp. MMO-174]|uniref:glycerol-3-phosphate dehydrogenase/oxidase n=1 Tax=Kaistia sp. MMO-174 TaxID=3081256 RepID=UPI003017AEC8
MSPGQPTLDRSRMEAEIAADNCFDAVVVGGGITGAGTFRDLALQGLRVLLVERDDFASGASGALTRIAHGGFRYLERGDVGLVRESVIERDLLVANAPHVIRPVRVVLPLRTRLGGLLAAPFRFLKLMPGRGMPGVVPMTIGVRLYDALAGRRRALARGGAAMGAGARRLFPYLGQGFAGAIWTQEGRIHAPERIAVELVEDGVATATQSAALNYCRLAGAEGCTLTLENRLSGATFTVEARVVVNAGGAHADKVAALFGVTGRMTGGVAGIHVVIDAPSIAASLRDDLLFFEDHHADPAKRRLCVLYRLAGNRLLLGTTEFACDDPDEATIRPADEDYLLKALDAALPGHGVTKEAITGRIVGVRPLIRSKAADLTSRSRSHAVIRHDPAGAKLITIIGGKWTTFRRMAEDAADAVLAELGRARILSTAHLAIGGGRDFRRADIIRDLVAGGLDAALAERLADTYGSRASRVAEWIRKEGGEPVSADGRLTRGEVAFFARAELAATAEDIVRRRSDQFFRSDDLETLTARVADELDRWS